MKSESLDKTFLIDGTIELIGKKSVKNKPNVFATYSHIKTLPLEFLRQINQPIDEEYSE